MQALWDTGATKSVISAKLAGKLGLVPTGVSQVTHGGGTDNCPTHVVNVTLLPNRLLVAGVTVAESAHLVHFDVIIGMDIITLGNPFDRC